MADRSFARGLLGLVLAVAGLEVAAAARSYRTVLDARDWQAVARALAAIPPDEPVVLADDWLGPRARAALPRLSEPHRIGRPDLRDAPRVHVLAWGARTWSPALTEDVDGLLVAEPVVRRDLGHLHLDTYALPRPARRVSDLAHAPDLRLAVEGVACRGGPERWTCPGARVARALLEVDGRPRQCLRVEADDGVVLTLAAPNFPTGDVLRGHLGFGDFNAALRSDAPARLDLRIGGRLALRVLATDEEGWKPFEVPVSAGVHAVEVDLLPALGGTWGATGYTRGAPRSLCFELRGLLREPLPQEGA